MPLWKYHLLHHNKDIMHIEKEKKKINNIIGSGLNLDDKTMDELKALFDLEDIIIRFFFFF